MKKSFIFSLVIVVLIIPQVTFAAWWNPSSWNWKALFQSPTPVETIQVPVSENDAQEIPIEKPKDIEVAKPKDELKAIAVPASTPPPINIPQYTISNNESADIEVAREQQRTQKLLSLIQELSDECTTALKDLEKERKALPEVKINTDSAEFLQGSAQVKQLAEAQKATIQAESNRLALIDIGIRQNSVIQYCANEDLKLRTELNNI